MTAAKLKSVILDAAQVRRVQEHGKLVRFVVIYPQPPQVIVARYCDYSDKFDRDNVWQYQVAETDKDSGITFNAVHYFGDGLCPFSPGERVWCKEEWRVASLTVPGVISKTGEGVVYFVNDPVPERSKSAWRPAADMPQHHSRLTLELASVEPVQIQDVSEEDAIAVGIERVGPGAFGFRDYEGDVGATFEPWESFCTLWDSTHTKPEEQWDANPWCWKEAWTKVEA
ncbi:MAG: hypothetical protein IID41_00560 [Planctomycetes bacterium]|nr:hypothetical protein [Planctomycetota bacterium]